MLRPFKTLVSTLYHDSMADRGFQKEGGGGGACILMFTGFTPSFTFLKRGHFLQKQCVCVCVGGGGVAPPRKPPKSTTVSDSIEYDKYHVRNRNT